MDPLNSFQRTARKACLRRWSPAVHLRHRNGKVQQSRVSRRASVTNLFDKRSRIYQRLAVLQKQHGRQKGTFHQCVLDDRLSISLRWIGTAAAQCLPVAIFCSLLVEAAKVVSHLGALPGWFTHKMKITKGARYRIDGQPHAGSQAHYATPAGCMKKTKKILPFVSERKKKERI